MAAFDEVYRVEYTRLVAELYAMTGSLVEAEDLVQDAFAKAFARWDRVSQLDQPAGWVRRVALNAATSRWRVLRRRYGGELPDDRAAVSDPPDRILVLIDVLRQLPSVQREAIVLHHLSGLSVGEIARTLDCPASTVKARLQRGRTRLALLLAEDAQEVGDR